MSKHKPKSQRKPHYKKAQQKTINSSIVMVEWRKSSPRHIVRLQNGGRRYKTTLIGSMIMLIAALASGGVMGFIFCAMLHLMLGVPVWAFLLLFVPIWLRLTESWWFGLTTRKFADVYTDKVIVYGAFGRKKYVFDYRQCRFFFRPFNRTAPALWVKRANHKLPIRINTTLCADWKDFLYEVGSSIA